MTDIEDAIRIEAKLLLLGNICKNCYHLYSQGSNKHFCGTRIINNEEYRIIKLNHTCEYWKPQL